MHTKRILTGVLCCFGLFVLTLDSKTAVEGAHLGIDLCLKTVIPSLFPFFVLSLLLLNSLNDSNLILLKPLGRLCCIPPGSEGILVGAFLGGYPVGAQNIAYSFRNGMLSRNTAERMLAFCSNAGPAFIFGITSALFPNKWMPWALWTIHILSAIGVSMIFPLREEITTKMDNAKCNASQDAILCAVRSMACVCGWVILFRVLITFFEKWTRSFLSLEMQTILTGLLELANGCCQLESISNVSVRFVLCSAFLAFGGLCVTMQTISVTQGLSIRSYCLGKSLQTMLSIAISASIVNLQLIPYLTFFVFFLFILKERKKRIAFIKRSVYNNHIKVRRKSLCFSERR